MWLKAAGGCVAGCQSVMEEVGGGVLQVKEEMGVHAVIHGGLGLQPGSPGSLRLRMHIWTSSVRYGPKSLQKQ